MGCASQAQIINEAEQEIQDQLTYIGAIYNDKIGIQQSIFQFNKPHTTSNFSYITINIQSTSYVTQIFQQQYIDDIQCLKLVLSGPNIPENFKHQAFDYQITTYQEPWIKFDPEKRYIFVVTAILRNGEEIIYNGFQNIQKVFSEQECLQTLNVYLQQDYDAVFSFGPMWLQQSIQLLLLYYQKNGIGLYELICCAKRLVMQSDISLYNNWISLQPVEQTFKQQVDKTYLIQEDDLLPLELEYQQSKIHKNILYQLKYIIYQAFNLKSQQNIGRNNKQMQKITDQQIINLLLQHHLIKTENGQQQNIPLQSDIVRPFSNHTNPVSSKIDALQTRSFSPQTINSQANVKTGINSQALDEYQESQVVNKQRVFSAENNKMQEIPRSRSVNARQPTRTARSVCQQYNNNQNIKNSKSSANMVQQQERNDLKVQSNDKSRMKQINEIYSSKSLINIVHYIDQETSEANRTQDSTSEAFAFFKVKASSKTMPVNDLANNINIDVTTLQLSANTSQLTQLPFKKIQSVGKSMNLAGQCNVSEQEHHVYTRTATSQNSQISPNKFQVASCGSPHSRHSPIKQCSFVSDIDQIRKSLHSMDQIDGVLATHFNGSQQAQLGLKVETLSENSDISSIQHVSSDHARQISF